MIGDRLKELREERKMKQDELSVYLNVSRQSISGYENNTSEPSIDTLIKIADLFNVSIDYLVNRTKERRNLNLLDKNNKELLLKLYDVIEDYKIMKK